MPPLKDIAAFIFDLDGLVLDTEPTYFAAWQQTVAAMGYQLEPEVFKALSGRHYQQVIAQLQAWLGRGFDMQAFSVLSKEIWRKQVSEQGISIKPGVIMLLDYAQERRIPYCLATNSLAAYAQECLTLASLSSRFPLRVTGSDVENVKPAPDIFLKAADMMGVNISQCIVFEDSHTGVVAAAASGAYTVYVPSTCPVNPLTVELCDLMLGDLSQAVESLP